MTDHRFEVFWGSFNIMLAIRDMIDTAYRVEPDFRRAVLITGDTLPLLPCDRLQALLLDETKEYLSLRAVADRPELRDFSMKAGQAQAEGNVMPRRFQNFIFSDDALLSPKSRSEVMRIYGFGESETDHVRGSVSRIAETILSGFPPRPPLYATFFYGESWWALTRDSIDLMVGEMHQDAHVDYFRLMHVPDEHFVQTLLGNKMDQLSRLGHVFASTPVYVDHADPERARFGRDALTAAKFREAAHRGAHLFARKFDPELVPKIADAIEWGRYDCDILGF